MQRWTVTDRQGREIYVPDLPEPYDTIIVFVAFRFHHGTVQNTLSNNFVTTAWGDVSIA
jgi:hypothetical protein